jgi:hypothetical protein
VCQRANVFHGVVEPVSSCIVPTPPPIVEVEVGSGGVDSDEEEDEDDEEDGEDGDDNDEEEEEVEEVASNLWSANAAPTTRSPEVI